jgi:hypothetical protein
MRRGCAVIGFGLWLWSAPAAAQPSSPDVVRPDIAGSIGWLNVNKSELSSSNDWYNRGLHGAVTAGWYWSTHLKTELEASASKKVRFFASRELLIDGIRSYAASEHTFTTRRVSIAQAYQFEENAWFHPHVSAGVDFNWETTTRFDREIYQYLIGSPGRIIRPAIREPERTDLHVRPFAAVGFKAYMTPRGFFRTDARVSAGKRLEEILFRFGFGVDF